jgi:hypothetical protein
LADFFDLPRCGSASARPNQPPLNIVYGCGAALTGWPMGCWSTWMSPRTRSSFASAPAASPAWAPAQPLDPKAAYKRSYFVDWVAANRHKLALHERIDWIVDGQRPDEITFARGDALRRGLAQMAASFFRVRPWFEPGPWGGQWIRQHMPQLAQDVPNYAWSFELIVPENGLLFESDGWLLEVSFDFLMHRNPHAILGEAPRPLATSFPSASTFSTPSPAATCRCSATRARRMSASTSAKLFTQDETYYILEAGPDARCYLGFQDDIDPAAFRAALERQLPARHGRSTWSASSRCIRRASTTCS